MAASSSINGPTSVSVLIGSPIFNLTVLETILLTNSSAMLSCSIIRFTAMHTCPALRKDPLTAARTAFSISASSSTTSGSLPPSSRVIFFILVFREIEIPVSTLPVNEILFTIGLKIISSPIM